MEYTVVENGGMVQPPAVSVYPRPAGSTVRKHRFHDDEEQGKLFVGGLSWDTTQDTLLRYFGRFGEVIDCVVMKNAESGRSRGFGFVTFNDPANIDAVLSSCPHTLDGRTIDPKACNPRSMQKPKKSNFFPKIFLGGLPSNITETDLRNFFSRCGEVCEVVIMYDQEKKKSRGFGFLSYADEEAVNRVCAEHFVNIQNKRVEIKRAEPGSSSMNDKSDVQMDHWGGMAPMSVHQPQTIPINVPPQQQPQRMIQAPPPPLIVNGHHQQVRAVQHVHHPVPPQQQQQQPAYSSWTPQHSVTPPQTSYPQYASTPIAHWGPQTVPQNPPPTAIRPPPPPQQPQQWTTSNFATPPPHQPPQQSQYSIYPPPPSVTPQPTYWSAPPVPTPPPAAPPTPRYASYPGFSQYQTHHAAPPALMAAPQKPPPYITTTNFYHQNSAAPPPPVAASPPGYHSDLASSLGPQRSAMYSTQPSQYHPYRRS